MIEKITQKPRMSLKICSGSFKPSKIYWNTRNVKNWPETQKKGLRNSKSQSNSLKYIKIALETDLNEFG